MLYWSDRLVFVMFCLKAATLPNKTGCAYTGGTSISNCWFTRMISPKRLFMQHSILLSSPVCTSVFATQYEPSSVFWILFSAAYLSTMLTWTMFWMHLQMRRNISARHKSKLIEMDIGSTISEISSRSKWGQTYSNAIAAINSFKRTTDLVELPRNLRIINFYFWTYSRKATENTIGDVWTEEG